MFGLGSAQRNLRFSTDVISVFLFSAEEIQPPVYLLGVTTGLGYSDRSRVLGKKNKQSKSAQRSMETAPEKNTEYTGHFGLKC